jgi:hypothetical protein
MSSDETSWSKSIRIAQPMNDVCKDNESPVLLPDSASLSPIIDTSVTLSDENPPSNSPPPRQVQESITVQPLQPSTSQNIPTRNSLDHLYHAQLGLLSKLLYLPDDVVSAAKRIITRVQADTHFQSVYRRSQKITSSLVTRAAILEACRQLGVPKTFKEIEINLTQDQKVHFHKIFRLIDSILKKDAMTNLVSENESHAFPALFSVRDFIFSQAKTLSLNDVIRDRALLILENRDVQNLFSGKRANVGAAVVLAFAAACEKYNLDKVHYARVANISLGTFVSSQKGFFNLLQDMLERGELPLPFRS